MEQLALITLGSAAALFVYAYAGYPAILWLLSRVWRWRPPTDDPAEWPMVSVTVPVYNEERQVRALLDSLLALDYPEDRLQILIVSDASTDATDDIVREYADRGVELLRMPDRGGKTRAENAAAAHLRGRIIVNTDASIRIPPPSLKALIRMFSDPSVGLASGRDVSVGSGEDMANAGETSYVGYEMAIRDLETALGGIIGASGCFYAILDDLHRLPLPDSLSRDFAAALHTQDAGYRPVSVSEAVCYVPRTSSLRREYRRKVRTITRGIETLWHERRMLNPFRHPLFAWKLLSHKIARWMLPWAASAAFLATAILAPGHPAAAVLVGAGTVILVLAAAGWALSERPHVPRLLAVPAYLVAGNVAAMEATLRALGGDRHPTWEPTRRPTLPAG